MKLNKNILLWCLFTPSVLFAQTDSQKSASMKIIEAEKAFAQTSVEEGTKNAFLKFLSTDAVVFEKGMPVNGLEYWQTQEFKNLFTWQPMFTDMAVSEEMGYTTGNFQVHSNTPEDKPVAHGSFFTLWKKQGDGVWKVALDFGVNHPEISNSKASMIQNYSTFKPDLLKNTPTLAERMVFMNDHFYWKNAKTALNPFEPHLSQNVRIYRNNILPIFGREQAKDYLKKSYDKALVYTGLKAISSQAGDLVCVYGVVSGSSKTGEYVRVWKQETKDTWKIVLEMVNINLP